MNISLFYSLSLIICHHTKRLHPSDLEFLFFSESFKQPCWAEAFAIRSPGALTVAKVLLAKQVFVRYGCPRQLLSDQGSCFEAALFQNLCQFLGIDKLRTTAHQPSANGQIE